MFENKKVKKSGVHYSRYIASWRIAGGTYYDEEFASWLKSQGADDDEVRDILELANCGKMELEMDIKLHFPEFSDVLRMTTR